MGQLRHMGPADGLHHDRLQLRNFRCCEGARVRQVEFQVDPVDPSLWWTELGVESDTWG